VDDPERLGPQGLSRVPGRAGLLAGRLADNASMKLQTKFYLGVIIVFALLAAVIALVSVDYVNTNTIREAENRVNIYARSAWEIHNGGIAQIRSAAKVLARRPSVVNSMLDPANEHQLDVLRADLEAIRQEQGVDVLDLIAPDGTVVLRTRSPYSRGDNVADDPLFQQVSVTFRSSAGNEVWAGQRLADEGPDLVDRCRAVAGESEGMVSGAAVPILSDGRLIGVIEMAMLLNGSVEEVDRIRDAVFENESYKGKPVGTATIFMGDLRISTNVLNDQGQRALGTRVSREVAARVLDEGQSWTGRAFVVDTWYLAQYDPIKAPNGEIVGMLYVGELEQKYLDMRTRAVALYLSVVMGGMVLAFFTTFLLTRGILNPIHRLSEATHYIARGDLTHRVTVQSRDEVGDLSASFNQMAQDLERQRQEIVRNQQDLEALNDELRSINRNYMEMLGFVAHELKNPLTSAMMSLYSVKDGFLGDVTPEQKKSLESVAVSLDYFQDMIKNYLDLSRLEEGEMEVNRTEFALHERVLAPVLEGLGGELAAGHMTVKDHVPGDLVLHADPNLLHIVYNNLLSNAVRYGREGGTIQLEARQGMDRVTLSVYNEGEGIPPDKMSRLFQKFSRLEAPEYTGQRGTGLGLYICKEIVEKQGGEIWADSRPGEWVKFSFTLPR
jgi:two-component system NtrC family sensor kinase